MNILSRRHFLRLGTAAGAACLLPRLRAAEQVQPFGFYVVSDTHYLAPVEDPGVLDEVSAETNTGLIRTLNGLAGVEIPATAGGGRVLEPRGVLHAGDLVDSGTDKNGGPFYERSQTEWAAFQNDFGVTGSDGLLRYPVYETWGNHDSPQGRGLILDGIRERNRKRPGIQVSPNGLHYSWDWNGVHFLCLGLIVGGLKYVDRKRRYAAVESLDFLVSDLATRVGDTGRPVVIMHHVDMARYITPAATGDEELKREWDSSDVRAYFDAIRRYNVVAIFYGHTHARNIFRWSGDSTKTPEGVPVFNVDNAAHFKSDAQAFYYVEARDGSLVVREHATADRWKTTTWTPQTWTVPLARPS